MAFGALIHKDSISPDGVRLLTFEVSHPRSILAEVNTHKMISKNSASSRAIPTLTMMKRLRDDPYAPLYWGKNKKGMQATEELDEATQKLCLEEWLGARDDMLKRVTRLHELGLHKQDANRLLEPFMYHTCLLSGTEWSNFFHLRNHPDAHPAFQTIAAMMQELFEESTPTLIKHGDYHRPLVDEDELHFQRRVLAEQGGVTQADIDEVVRRLNKVSIGRCARVSNLTHDGVRDQKEDIGLHGRMLGNGHMSPFEHVARPATKDDGQLAMVRWKDVGDWGELPSPDKLWFGNFRGWVQERKTIPFEDDMMAPRSA